MPLRVAGRLCPHGIFVPGDHARYAELSDGVMALFAKVTPLVEPISLDEAFLDVTASAHLFGGPEETGRLLKRRVRTELGLVLSVGVATNKLCAKIASDLGKPDGFVRVEPGGEAAFVAPLPLRRLWGVGERTQAELESMGLRTIGDLARADPALFARFRLLGSALHERACGIDDDPVEPDLRPKSVGGEHTFEEDETDEHRVEATLLRLAERVATRLRADGLRGRRVTVKLRVAPFVTSTRQHHIAEATDDAARIFGVARELLRRERATDPRAVRLIGVSVSALEHADLGLQLEVFADERRSRLNAALDAVRARHGDAAIERAAAREGETRRRMTDRRAR